MKSNIIKEKSFAFALNIIANHRQLISAKKEFIMSKQLLRSGTSIGAMVREAEHAESSKDFIHKMSIALKEANETDYWLELLRISGYISKENAFSLIRENTELLKILIAIIRTSKAKRLN